MSPCEVEEVEVVHSRADGCREMRTVALNTTSNERCTLVLN